MQKTRRDELYIYSAGSWIDNAEDKQLQGTKTNTERKAMRHSHLWKKDTLSSRTNLPTLTPEHKEPPPLWLISHISL